MALSLPPLNAIRAFEAAGRTGSYVAAARELGVTPAAVSQQVRKLEEHLAKRLFRRFNNRIALTDAGQSAFAQVSEALHQIAALSQPRPDRPAHARLVISVLPSVANRWVESRLARIAIASPDLRFDLRVEEDPVDFAGHEIDLRLCYGSTLYPDHTTIHLHQDAVAPMASPAYLERRGLVAGEAALHAPEEDLIHTEWGPGFGSHPTWAEWFAAEGAARPLAGDGYRVGMSALALDLARDGVGVALGQRLLAADDVAAGRLVVLSPTSVALGHPYSLVHLRSKRRKRGLADLVARLLADAGGT